MPADTTTFLLAFLALFGLLGAYLIHLERRAKTLEERLRSLEEASTSEMKASPPGRGQA